MGGRGQGGEEEGTQGTRRTYVLERTQDISTKKYAAHLVLPTVVGGLAVSMSSSSSDSSESSSSFACSEGGLGLGEKHTGK